MSKLNVYNIAVQFSHAVKYTTIKAASANDAKNKASKGYYGIAPRIKVTGVNNDKLGFMNGVKVVSYIDSTNARNLAFDALVEI